MNNSGTSTYYLKLVIEQEHPQVDTFKEDKLVSSNNIDNLKQEDTKINLLNIVHEKEIKETYKNK